MITGIAGISRSEHVTSSDKRDLNHCGKRPSRTFAGRFLFITDLAGQDPGSID